MAKIAKLFIKIAFTGVLLYFVFSKIDIKSFLASLKNINIGYFLISFLLYNISKIISSFRLNYYFKEIGINLKESINLRLYYIGMFYNLYLPGGIGGDGYKGWLLHKYFDISLKDIIKALFFDRVSGLVAILFLLLVLLPFSSISKFYFYFLMIGAVLLYFLYYYISRKYKLFFSYFNHTAMLGFIVQIIQVLSAIALINALNININLIDFINIFLISSIVAALPLTFGGIGAREATFLYGFSYLNYSPDLGVAFSLLFFFIIALSSLIGILFIGSFRNIDYYSDR